MIREEIGRDGRSIKWKICRRVAHTQMGQDGGNGSRDAIQEGKMLRIKFFGNMKSNLCIHCKNNECRGFV